MAGVRGFYWRIPPRPEHGGLAGMPLPGPTTLTRLPTLGIGMVVSLLGLDRDVDAECGNQSDLPSLTKRYFPIISDTPGDDGFADLALLCEQIHTFRGSGRGVAVHCLQGQQRTGMVLACYHGYVLKRYPDDPDGMDPDAAAEALCEQLRLVWEGERGVTGPTRAQMRFARRFVAGL